MVDRALDASHLSELVHLELLQHAKSVYEEQGTLTDDVLSALHFMFGPPLLQALDLVDHQSVTLIKSEPAGRIVYQVVGSSGSPYLCLPSAGYCPCLFFSFAVLKRKEVPMCKHMLAILLASAMGLVKETTESDDHVTNLLLSAAKTDAEPT
ncbi:zinc finger SWIM domain-containing protein 7-like [Strongylocentrotus purpuratus]|uniref:SWIM-type domain-containing protein n=1 Tax=Strongylocentrotus purpuratus TaxID=7668 RepID=A0A7M7P8U4_STRPU|nr:zinc finger SWIM domain-containing protein 7-like [Strongylocentrotus purpuratus]XP_030847514.1 zinc finger SWIM domain-containing protein 7-like [Strongylocentrotus purpuratus]XP_030847515.1 zinc finger SWIM domain-containing protein 7-like [Strongylocentrotus purpuratus]